MDRSADDILDEWLVIRCQAGEPEALRRLVGRWQARLLAHARRLLDRGDAAADATQEAWLAIVRGLHRLDDPARFGPWAYAILTNKCRDAQRRGARASAESIEDRAAPQVDADDGRDELRVALRSLSPDHRAVLALHYLDGMALADIATALEVPVGTVKSRLHHARDRLRASLERLERTRS
jgi:RNA polymerase sigma-70 factor (ECF subfamily)